jgi:glycosidase
VALPWQRNPHIYEINTRLWLRELSEKYGKPIKLGAIPEEELSQIRNLGFDALWLMGAWLPSPRGQDIARSIQALRAEFTRALPDLSEEDILASPYAVHDYLVNPELGGEKGLRELRALAHDLGFKLILDFVPNHVAIDHPWITFHPELFVRGDEADLATYPGSFFQAPCGDHKPTAIIAHGRDPYFPAWTDTAQLNYFNPLLRSMMIEVLQRIASLCDGVRCDMAMLILRDIHYQIWQDRLFDGLPEKAAPREEFWSQAIREIKALYPHFLFVAETYWMREGELQSLGFDYTYDKALYDWIKAGEPHKIKEYIKGPTFYQEKCLRFIENHDEERARSVLGEDNERSAALLMASLPGAHLYHEGQLDGYRIKCPVQLGRRLHETLDAGLREFYEQLLRHVTTEAFRKGSWLPIETYPAWEDNYTCHNFIIYLWYNDTSQYLVVINLSPHRSQCYAPIPLRRFLGMQCSLRDLLEENFYVRDGDVLTTQGLYLDMRGYYRHLFKITVSPKT